MANSSTKKPATKKPTNNKSATKKPEQKGKLYERLVAAVTQKMNPTSSVEWDVKIRANSLVTRQFDAEMRGPENSDDALVLIEARDRICNVTINMVGDFNTALKSVGATKGIMVSRRGFTEDALRQAKECGIETWVLRLADDAAWEGYVRGMDMQIQPMVLRYDDAEMTLANGTTVAVPRPQSCILNVAGGIDFFDRIASDELSKGKWIEGEPIVLKLGPGVTMGEEEPIEVTLLRFRPRYKNGLAQEFSVTRPEDWVYMRYLPGQRIDIKRKKFFEFRELDELAAEIKKAKEVKQAKQIQKVKKARGPSGSRP
jgi:hypothetical protein